MGAFSRDKRPLNVQGKSLSKVIKVDADTLMEWLKQINNREGMIARMKLEECVMWATKGIAGLKGPGES
ncbi:MAG: hypothetical protein QNJ87_01130 [Gammaproteobacteria bacterium]|nr:hypothetical protein [Gammaproteobacteria bacterium]MDJ0870351.1 hypothetical protein [Gammaproteobacteria bacterium]MDJ0891357.1 hypothetical protein [Gammaproteobacteria bacterium]